MNLRALMIASMFVGVSLAGVSSLQTAAACKQNAVETHSYAATSGVFLIENSGGGDSTGVSFTGAGDSCTNPAYNGDTNSGVSNYGTGRTATTGVGDGQNDLGFNGGVFGSYQTCLDYNYNHGAPTAADVATPTGAVYAGQHSFLVTNLLLPILATAGTDGPADAAALNESTGSYYAPAGATQKLQNCTGNGVVSNDPSTDPADCGQGTTTHSGVTSTATILPNDHRTGQLANCDKAADGNSWVFLTTGAWVSTTDGKPIVPQEFFFTSTHYCSTTSLVLEEVTEGDAAGDDVGQAVTNIQGGCVVTWATTGPAGLEGGSSDTPLQWSEGVSVPTTGTIV